MENIAFLEHIDYPRIIHAIIYKINVSYVEGKYDEYMRGVHTLKCAFDPYISSNYKCEIKKIMKAIKYRYEKMGDNTQKIEAWREIYKILMRSLAKKGLLLNEKVGIMGTKFEDLNKFNQGEY